MFWTARPAGASPRRAIRRAGTAGAIAFVAVMPVALFATPDAASPARAAAIVQPLTLLQQDFAIAEAGTLTMSFQPPQPLGADDSIVVSAYRNLTSPEAFAKAVDGEYGIVVDTVRLDAAGAEHPAVVISSDGAVTLSLDT
ncbi:MAG TPA: hypothetical protein PLV68_09660, partial [Ilumatobacteraceae bacterium]|nr:hypothetical protein [Ilumatobacteraceae bacterium]